MDGLLTLAEYFRGQQSHEQAFQLVRRAAYALECGFHPGFSPFRGLGVGHSALRPCVVLRLSKEPTWPGWSWLRTLWLHMQGLAGQGMYRSALEGCKLLLAATLPRDPAYALLSCDYLCLRARQYDLLPRLASQLIPQCGLQGADDAGPSSCLDMAFPNFAYSAALASFLKAGQPTDAALNEVTVADVASAAAGAGSPGPEEPAAQGPHARLMRALLFFPLGLRPLLEEAGAKLQGPPPGGSPSREAWADLLARPPFSDAADFRHERHAAAHGRLCGAYARRCGALWRADPVLRWLHACAARLAGMHASPLFASELAAARAAWSAAPLCLAEALAEDYLELLPDDGPGSEATPRLPPALERAAQARLHPPHPRFEEAEGAEVEAAGALGFGLGGPGAGAAAGAAARGQPPPTISLHSPPLLVFFQSLLPWGELDRSGVQVEPLRWSDVGRGLADAARAAAILALGAAADVARLVASLAQKAWACCR